MATNVQYLDPFQVILSKLDTLEQKIVDLTTRSVEPVEEILLSPEQACKVFDPKISKQTLYNWSNQGLIQMHKIGGRSFYKRSEILSSLITLKKYKSKNF